MSFLVSDVDHGLTAGIFAREQSQTRMRRA